MTDLWPHQTRCVEQARQRYREGSRAILVVAPTGAGKTVIGAHLVAKPAELGRVLWLVHREELREQARAKLDPRVKVETIQALVARPDYRPQATVVVFDEAHHFVADAWGEVATHYRGSLILGLTATPERADGRPLGDLFTSMVVAASYSELIAGGYLVQCEVYAPESRGKTLAMDPAEAVRRFADAGPAIVFCRTVEEAVAVAAKIPGAEALHEGTEWELRRRAVRRFRRGEIPALTSVYVLSEGFDAPNSAVCVLARGCGHASTYLQMVGRVLRRAPGKTKAILVDLTGVVHDHGLPTEDREYSLDGEAIRGGSAKADPIWQCRACGWCTRRPPADRRCPSCGKPLPVPEALRVEERRLQRLTTLAGHNDMQRASAWARIQEEAREKGYRPGWAYHRYHARYGTAPPRSET